jgi:hypothetical protein
MRHRLPIAVLLAQSLSCATALIGGEIARGSLQVQGVALEIDTPAVTTGIDIPTTIQTRFGGLVNDAAPSVEGLLAVGDLTGPGIDTPIQLTTAPGYKFQIPGFSVEGVYYLQNVRLMKGSDFVAPASPPAAAITVANVLQTAVKVHQLTPEEMRARGIVVDGRNYNVYEYSFTFIFDGQSIEVPFPVVVDPRTHEVIPIGKETPFKIPSVKDVQPPRWSPPDVIVFELPPDEAGGAPDAPPDPLGNEPKIKRPSIPAAIVIPNSLAVLHQFFAVLLTVSNGAPSGSTARLEDIRATIKVPAALRTVRSDPSVVFGQPVPIVDPNTGLTFLVAQAKGEAEWDIEGLRPGTHTIEIEVRARLTEVGQEDVPLKATPRASVVVHDPRFNITFSHPDVVRKGIEYSTYTFITNMSGGAQTIRLSNGLPSCDQAAGANVCRIGGADSDQLTLASGEMRMVEYKLRPGITGHVFATAGTIDDPGNISASVQLHMGVSETGIPLSPATLVMPYYARFLDPDLIDRNLELLGLGYSLATAPVNQTTAKLPRVIKSDVFYRAVDIARAGQRIFISDGNAGVRRDALFEMALDLLGNGVELRQWDDLRRLEKSGRSAGAAVIAELNEAGMAGRASVGELVDLLAAATSHRAPYLMAIAHGPAIPGHERPYALSIRGASGRRADVPNEAAAGWIRNLAFADVSRFDVPALGRAGEIALAGRWSEEVEVVITPTVTGPLTLEIVFPGTADGTAMRAHFDLNGTAGESLRVPLSRGATSINALLANGGFGASTSASPVVAAPLQIVGARQDLNLDPEGHKVSLLFNRPLTLQEGGDWRAKFMGSIAFNRDSVIYNGNRPIFAAAQQDDQRIVNLSFDHVLTTNAGYSIAVGPLIDPLTRAEVAFPQPLQPKIDNDRPAGILYGKFLKGDNTPIGGAEVRLYTGHWQGCKVGLLDEEPPIDCNPYKEAPQYARSEADGTFLFEYVPRDAIADPELMGGYELIGVASNGKFTILNGAVRLPGRVHFVNLQLLGRGAAEGVARYDDGEKVVGGEIYIGSSMFNVGRSTKTDGNGFFHVEDLPVGPITFAVKDQAGNVAFASGEIATPGQIVTKELVIFRKPFPGTGTVFGVVRRSDTNAPVVASRVGVYSQGFGMAEALTDSDGRFEFRKVPAGFVTLLAAEWSVSPQSAAIDFDLQADQVREANLVLGVAPANEVRATLSGEVIRENPLFPGDPAKYERVAGAIVKLGGKPVTADSDGRFTFDSLPLSYAGQGEITAYDPSTKRVGKVTIPTLTEGGPNNVTIFIPANSFGEGTIRVRLISATGQPVTGFRVIEPGYPPRPFNTVGGGLYQLSAPVGASIDIWAVNGPPLYGDQFAHGSAKLEFPGQVLSVTLRLPGEGKVRVKLRGDFDIINDVVLTYPAWDEAEQSPRPKEVTVSTNVNGIADFATFTKVPALEQYSVASLHPSYGYTSAVGRLGYDGDLAVHVLQMAKLATIRGTVYAIDGRTPIAGAAIRLDDGSRDTGISFTQPDGTFSYRDVPPGVHFSVSAETTQSGVYRAGVAYGKTPAAGGPLDNVAVIMRRRGSVEGKVVYLDYKRFDPDTPSNNIPDDTPNDLSDNAPVPLAKLWLRELDFPNRSFGSDAAPQDADIGGRFAFSSVFVGPLRARAWDSNNQELQGVWTGTLEEEGQPLTAYIGIGSGGTGTIEVTIADPNQSNAPVVNAEVGLYRGGLFDLTSSDASGVARFAQVPVGSYSVGAYSKALGKSGTSAAFSVQRDLIAAFRILLEFSGEVDGTLTDPESEPPGRGVPGATVTLTGAGYHTLASTDTVGSFTFDGVREGVFTLAAKDTESNRRASASRALSAADPHPVVNLQLERTETLHVGVYLPDDSGANSGVLAGPVSIDVVQRNGEFFRSAQGNPIVMPKLFAAESFEIGVKEIGGLQRELGFRGSFPKGTAADPVKLVYPAYGAVEVTVTQGGAPANGAKVMIFGQGTSATLFADATGKALAGGIRLGDVSAQAISFDGGFSGSTSGRLQRQSVTARLAIDLGAYAGVTGVVEAEAGGPSAGTRVLASFAGRTLEMSTGTDGRYTFQGIPTSAGGTAVSLTYIGTDGVTIGGRQSITLFNDSASKVIALPTVRLDATPPQIVSIIPADGGQNVSPDTLVRVVFSEPIRADQINNGHFQLIPADGTPQVTATFDPPVTAGDGTFVVTLHAPPPPPGQLFPLKSNTLYRVIVSGAIEDRTGHHLPGTLGITFTTSDYNEPRVIKVVPALDTPLFEQVTVQFTFNEPVDPAPWQPGGGASLHFYKLSEGGAGGQILAEKPGRAFIEPATGLTLNFAPDDPIEPESFYRVVFSGIRDLQGNALAEQTFHFFSFDRIKPFVRLISPVPDGFPLISGVEYTLGVDLRNESAGGTLATDVSFVDYLRVTGPTETYLTTIRSAPFGYRFVAPEAPEGGSTYTLRAQATDRSLNQSDPATITWTVMPNAPPKNVAIALTPSSAYPANSVIADVAFDDEGTFATASVVLAATKRDGSAFTETQTRQLSRATVADPWTTARVPFTLRPDLDPGMPATVTATVTDVRGLSTQATATLTLLTDTGVPEILSITPAPETTYRFNDRYSVEAVVRDAESAVAEVAFVVDGQTHRVFANSPGVVAGPEPGSRRFPSPQITVPAKNVDTRVTIGVTAKDYQGNATSRSFEIVYIGVNDPAVPKGSWLCPVDRAVVPAAQGSFALPLRVRATDDIAVTSVQFRLPGLADPIAATRVGTSNDYQATGTVTTPEAGSDFVVTAIVSDADPAHTIELPISIDVVAVDQTIDATQSITAGNLGQFDGKSVLVRSAAGRLVTHVPVTLRNLIVLDGGRVESLATTTTIEHRVDITVIDRLYLDCSSTIDVSRKGYLGGFGANSDGSGTRNESPLGRTVGNTTSGGAANSSASHGGLGEGTSGGTANNAYGSIFEPTELGAGGAAWVGGDPGESGGGAISLRTSTAPEALGRIVLAGAIRADGSGVGGNEHYYGAGGSVRVKAKQLVFSPLALVSANGGGAGGTVPPAGGGRIAVVASERLDLPAPLAQLQARGGPASFFRSLREGGAGTVYLKRPSQQFGELLVASYEVPDTSRSHFARATPLSGSLRFDRVEIGPHALVRFDESVTIGSVSNDRSAATVDASAVLLLPDDHPTGTVVAAPPAGSDLIRATNLALTIGAASMAGLANALVQLSVAPDRLEPFADYPAAVGGRVVSVAIPYDAPLGAATLGVRITDRADRVTTIPTTSYTVIDNRPPAIDAFTASPESLYPGRIISINVSASDDVAITRVDLTSQIGTSTPVVQTRTPNAKTTAQAFTVAVPIATPGGTAMSLEAAVQDAFPDRSAVKQIKNITILTDALAPQVTVTAPAANAIFQEASGATFTVRANVIDAEVGVTTVSVKVGEAAPVAMLGDGTPTGWRADVPVPNVDGTEPAIIPVTVTASDYESNEGVGTIQIRVQPLVDPNAPIVAWACGSSGAMYPPDFTARLRLHAVGTSPANGVQSVQFIVDGATITASRVGTTDFWEAPFTIPDRPDGTILTARAVATSVAGNSADLTARIVVITQSVARIAGDLTIDSTNAATYANRTVVVQSGTVTIATPLTIDRLALLGGKITQRAGGSEKLQLTTTRDLFIACDASIDVTGAGFGGNQTYPGATAPGVGSAGSHIGVGGVAAVPAASTYGSVYWPQQPGGGGENANPDNGRPGGGVVRIIASTLINEGAIRANGADRTCCSAVRGGAGGSIWVTAGAVAGRGTAEANGGATLDGPTGGGGAVSIESGSFGAVPWQLTARGGTVEFETDAIGGAGSVYVKTASSPYGELTIDNGGRGTQPADLPSLGQGVAASASSGTIAHTDTPPWFAGHWVEVTSSAGALKGTWRIGSISAGHFTLLPNGTETIAVEAGDRWQGVYRFDALRVPNGDALQSADPIRLGDFVTLQGPNVAGKFLDFPGDLVAQQVTIAGNVSLPSIAAADVTVTNGAMLAPARDDETPRALRIRATGTVTVENGAAIDASGRGYGAGRTYPGATPPGFFSRGSHLGVGTVSNEPAGSTFGSVQQPQEAGGGGAFDAGGGIIRIEAGSVINSGAIRANGGVENGGGGAGGSIWITTNEAGGTGTVQANGSEGGGGGAIAIERGSAAALPWLLSAATGDPFGNGGAGTIHSSGPASTYGDLIVDNVPLQEYEGFVAPDTWLPALGRGEAGSGTSGATLLTGRASDIPPYFVGHWVEIRSAAGSLKGTWRIASIAGTAVTLAPNGAESIALEGGDRWVGVYRFDSLKLRKSRLITPDRLIVTAPPDLDVFSSVRGNNEGPPAVNAARISVVATTFGSSVVGTAGAVIDADVPVSVIVKNATTSAEFTAVVSGDGSFGIGVAGATGDRITLKARDGNFFPLESPVIDLGTLPNGSPAATQFDKAAWSVDPAFKAQTIALDGTILAVASANVNGAASDALVVLDTTNPAAPGFVRAIPTAVGAIRDFTVAGGWAYVVGDRLGTIDLRSGSSTMNFADIDPDGSEEAIVVRGGFAYTAEHRFGFRLMVHVYDVTSPGSPRYLLSFDGESAQRPTDLLAYGSDHLIALSGGDVTLLDRREESCRLEPLYGTEVCTRRVGSLAIDTFQAWRGAIAGTRLYLVSLDAPELVVVDLTNPASPAIAARMPLPAPAGAVVSLETFNFIAATTAGLVASTPLPLELAGTIPTGGSAFDVAFGSETAYVANENGIAAVALSLPPLIDTSRITLSPSGSMVIVAGAARAVTGTGSLTVEVKNAATQAAMTVNADSSGRFSASLPASAGDVITVSAADGSGRIAGPVSVGAVPFGDSTNVQRIVIAGDDAFRSRTIKIEGSLLAIGGHATNGARSDKLVTYDLTTPSAPLQTQVVSTGYAISDIELTGGWAYVAGDRFLTVDLRTIGAPVNPDPDFTSGLAVAAAGNYAFLSGRGGQGVVTVFDVSNPAAPFYVSGSSTASGFQTDYSDLLLLGSDYLIGIGDRYSQWDVTVIDRRNVNALQRVGGLQIGAVTGFRGKIEGSLLYVAGMDGGVAVVDLSTPSSPRLVSTAGSPGLAYGIELISGKVIAADRAAGVSFFDRTSEAISLIGTHPVPGDAWDVALGRGYLYVANEVGLAVIQHDSFVPPPRIDPSRISLAANGTVTGGAGAITGQPPLTATVRNLRSGATIDVSVGADGSFAAMLPALPGDTFTVRATDGGGRSAGPVVVGTIQLGQQITVPGDPAFRARRVKADGTLLAVGASDAIASDKLLLFDLTNPLVPLQTRIVSTQAGTVRDFELLDGWAYVIGDRLTTIDLRNPLSQPNAANEPAWGRSLALSGGYAFASFDGQGNMITVYDVTTPASPRTRGAFWTSYIYNDLLAYGTDYLIGISDGVYGSTVTVIDRRDVNNLYDAGTLYIDQFTGFRGKVAGNRLYLTGQGGGVAVVDLSTPAAPALLSMTDTPGEAYGLDVSGETVMVADKVAGVSLFETSSGTFQPAASYSGMNSAWDLILRGTTLYVANETTLAVLDNVPAPPVIQIPAVSVAATTATTATVTGTNAIGGRAPVAIQVRNEKSGATSVAAAVDGSGSFTTSIAARAGEPLSLQATDSLGRSSRRLIGSVPFFTIEQNFRGTTDGDSGLLARRIAGDGSFVLAAGGASSNALLFRHPNASEPPSLANVSTGVSPINDFGIRSGFAFFAGDIFASVEYTSATPAPAFAADQCGAEYSLAIIGTHAFTGEGDCYNTGRIHIYDISTPAVPLFVRTHETSAYFGIFRTLIAAGSTLFAISPGSVPNVVIFNAADVNNLVRIGEIDIPGYVAYSGVVDGTTLYLTLDDAGIAIVDVSNPAAPQWRSMIDTPGLARAIALSGPNEIVVADAGGPGLTFIDVTDRQQPVILGSQPLPGNASDVKVVGDRIHVAAETRVYVLRRP